MLGIYRVITAFQLDSHLHTEGDSTWETYKWMRKDATNRQARFDQSLFSTLVANPPMFGWFLSQSLSLDNSMQSYNYRIVGITPRTNLCICKTL